MCHWYVFTCLLFLLFMQSNKCRNFLQITVMKCADRMMVLMFLRCHLILFSISFFLFFLLYCGMIRYTVMGSVIHLLYLHCHHLLGALAHNLPWPYFWKSERCIVENNIIITIVQGEDGKKKCVLHSACPSLCPPYFGWNQKDVH